MDPQSHFFHAYPISLFSQNILDCMEGAPPMSSSVDKTGVKLIIIIITG